MVRTMVRIHMSQTVSDANGTDARALQRGGSAVKADQAEEVSLDPFVGLDTYPDASVVFSWAPKSLEESKDDALVAIDTNSLLLPFGASSRGLQAIGARYRNLAEAGRLIIPGQVAREYAKNKMERIANLY